MIIFLIYAFLFSVGSVIGWVIEVFFRHWFSSSNPEHRWVNPGFCIGPYLPLYGFGLCILYFMAEVIKRHDMNRAIEWLLALFLIAVLLTALEYAAGIFLIKVANVRLWDYSKMPGNINGLVCPLFTTFWVLLGMLYYIAIHSHILGAVAWLASNLAFSFVIGVFYGVFSIDVGYSVNFVSKVKTFADENGLVVKYEELKHAAYERRMERKEKMKFFFNLPPVNALHDTLEQYRSNIEEKLHAIDK